MDFSMFLLKDPSVSALVDAHPTQAVSHPESSPVPLGVTTLLPGDQLDQALGHVT